MVAWDDNLTWNDTEEDEGHSMVPFFAVLPDEASEFDEYDDVPSFEKMRRP